MCQHICQHTNRSGKHDSRINQNQTDVTANTIVSISRNDSINETKGNECQCPCYDANLKLCHIGGVSALPNDPELSHGHGNRP